MKSLQAESGILHVKRVVLHIEGGHFPESEEGSYGFITAG